MSFIESLSSKFNLIFQSVNHSFEKDLGDYLNNCTINILKVFPRESEDVIQRRMRHSMEEYIEIGDVFSGIDCIQISNDDLLEASVVLTILRFVEIQLDEYRKKTIQSVRNTELYLSDKKTVLTKYFRIYSSLGDLLNKIEYPDSILRILKNNYFVLLDFGNARIRFTPLALEFNNVYDSVIGINVEHNILLFFDARYSNNNTLRYYAAIDFSIRNMCDLIRRNWRNISQGMDIPENIEELLDREPSFDYDLGICLEDTKRVLTWFCDRIESNMLSLNQNKSLQKNDFRSGYHLNSDYISHNLNNAVEVLNSYPIDYAILYLQTEDLLVGSHATIDIVRWLIEILSYLVKNKNIQVIRHLNLRSFSQDEKEWRLINKRLVRVTFSPQGDFEFDSSDSITQAKLELLDKMEQDMDIQIDQMDIIARLLNSAMNKDFDNLVSVSSQIIDKIPLFIPNNIKSGLIDSLTRLYEEIKRQSREQNDYYKVRRRITDSTARRYGIEFSDVFISTLSTAELLYERYKLSSDQLNFNVFVLAYLEAFEIALNDLFYQPYIKHILDSEGPERVIIDPSNSHNCILYGTKQEKTNINRKYFGDEIKIRKGDTIPTAVELGSIGVILSLFKYIDEFDSFVRNKYPHYSPLSIIDLGKAIVDNLKDIRNAAAHGSKKFSFVELDQIKAEIFPSSMGDGGKIIAFLVSLGLDNE